MKDSILRSVQECVKAVNQLTEPRAIAFIEEVAELLAQQFRSGQKVLIAGNGGSLCDATHFAEELTGFFRKKRSALPVIALADPGHITCVANDIGFDSIFSRGIDAYGQEGDVFIGLTTSGNSPNLVNAFELAKERNLYTVALLGKEGGKLKGCADFELIIGGFSTSDRIQEAHMAALHVMIEIVEYHLFPNETIGAKVRQREPNVAVNP